MDTDRFLSRLVAGSVCFFGLLLIATLAWQVVGGYETDKNVHDLTYLIVGGLLGQVTTHSTRSPDAATQDINVPNPLPSPEPAAEPAPPVAADIHPDAPATSDL